MSQGPAYPAGYIQNPPIVTSLPTNPIDGDEVYYLASSTYGVLWHLKYRAADPSSFKWLFVGGPPLAQEYNADDTTGSTSLVALANPLSIVAPLSGNYHIWHTVREFYHTGGPGVATTQSALFVNSVQANAYLTAWHSQSALPVSVANMRAHYQLAAGDVVQQRSQAPPGTNATFGFKALTLQPVRVG